MLSSKLDYGLKIAYYNKIYELTQAEDAKLKLKKSEA
jgi:hypothetical protein